MIASCGFKSLQVRVTLTREETHILNLTLPRLLTRPVVVHFGTSTCREHGPHFARCPVNVSRAKSWQIKGNRLEGQLGR